MIQTITEKARSMMIDSQALLVFWGEAVNTAVYLHQRTPNKGLMKWDGRDGNQAPYTTHTRCWKHLASPLITMMAMNLVQSTCPPPSAIPLLRQLTLPRAATQRKSQPKIHTMYDGRLRVRFKYTLENMGPSIPSSMITVQCHV
jgi:hypothetical protein